MSIVLCICLNFDYFWIGKKNMSDSDESCNSVDWVPYSERSEWKDVTPIPQHEGQYPVVQIAYSEKCMLILRKH